MPTEYVNHVQQPQQTAMASEKATNQAEHGSDWLGLEASKPQRILDYGRGSGTVSSGLLTTFPLAVFRGIDNLDSQVKLYNDEASSVLGPNYQARMSAIAGDLHETHKTPILDNPEWFGFDSLIISFALHHVEDPIHSLELLKARVKPGGTIVVVDWPKKGENDNDAAAAAQGVPQDANTDTPGKRNQKYNPDNMLPVPMGKVWPGFSLLDIREDYEAAGLTNVDVRIWPNKIKLPQMATWLMMPYAILFSANLPVSEVQFALYERSQNLSAVKSFLALS
ncbi:hypothetical protein OQA88_12510 [Cercophora sp. LCS_1]